MSRSDCCKYAAIFGSFQSVPLPLLRRRSKTLAQTVWNSMLAGRKADFSTMSVRAGTNSRFASRFSLVQPRMAA